MLISNNIKFFFLHPLMLALYVWIILILLLPDYFQKYTAEIINVEYRYDYDKIYYKDLNGDGISGRKEIE